MTRDEMIQRIQDEHPDLSKVAANRLLQTVFDAVLDGLKDDPNPKEKTQRIAGFGIFRATVTPARRGMNPRTGSPIDLPARVRMTFRPSTGVAEQIRFTALSAPAPAPPPVAAKPAKAAPKRRATVAAQPASMR